MRASCGPVNGGGGTDPPVADGRAAFEGQGVKTFVITSHNAAAAVVSSFCRLTRVARSVGTYIIIILHLYSTHTAEIRESHFAPAAIALSPGHARQLSCYFFIIVIIVSAAVSTS